MAIVQTQAQLRVIGNRIGVPPERCDQIKAHTPVPMTVAALRPIVNRYGFYNEKADQFVAGGVTFA